MSIATRLARVEKQLSQWSHDDHRQLFWIVIGDDPTDEERAKAAQQARAQGKRIVVWE